MIQPHALVLIAMATSASANAAGPLSPTEEALRRCLHAPAAASTAGQTECEGAAARRYDQQMNVAYVALMRRLPPAAAARLRSAQRAWLAFRAADDAARSALYETRQGTMYVPMQAAASAGIVRDRAIQLEDALRVMTIDE
jgi:uncharacterized protein YecT (DUF1311 family)